MMYGTITRGDPGALVRDISIIESTFAREIARMASNDGKRAAALFGTLAFTAEEQQRTDAYLRQKLNTNMLSRRPGPGGRRLTYLESCKAIEIANEAFGFNGWSCRIVDCNLEYKEKDGSGRWSVGYSSVVRIELKDGATHEDAGFGQSEGLKDLGAAIDQSKKVQVHSPPWSSPSTRRAFLTPESALCDSSESTSAIPATTKRYICLPQPCTTHKRPVAYQRRGRQPSTPPMRVIELKSAAQANNVPLQSPTSIKLEHASHTSAQSSPQPVEAPTAGPATVVPALPSTSTSTNTGVVSGKPPVPAPRPPAINPHNQFTAPPTSRPPPAAALVKQEPTYAPSTSYAQSASYVPRPVPQAQLPPPPQQRPAAQQHPYPRPLSNQSPSMSNQSPSMSNQSASKVNQSASLVNQSPLMGSAPFDRKRGPVCMYPGDPGVDLDDLRFSQFEFDATDSNKKHKA
ncbi:Rad52/22 domain-containing protein [Achlya hypogyna]|uniref:Rad52/22 domain-containing protein n=1 Tax=Achlya hypogyna TaxID=1202772 RepID=A0A1V9YMQ1_ACHHY|nr:Rad52/22 domain-containing protein [Achlya hypogyna]